MNGHLDRDGVLDPEDEDVPRDEDEVEVEQDHRLDGRLQDELRVNVLILG
jgi:hypothetical protein